jgi:hypothetical protein
MRHLRSASRRICDDARAQHVHVQVTHIDLTLPMILAICCCFDQTGMLHNKLLRLHGGYTEHASSGFVINLIATDVQRFDLASTALHFGWMAVVDLIVIGIIVCYQVRLTKIRFFYVGLFVYFLFVCFCHSFTECYQVHFNLMKHHLLALRDTG